VAGSDTAQHAVECDVHELVRRRGFDPANRDAAAVHRLIDEVVAYYQGSLMANLPCCSTSPRLASSVADGVAGVGPLQPFFDDPGGGGEIWINEPGKVVVAQAGRG
jgi:pilus assembly protein CpaF